MRKDLEPGIGDLLKFVAGEIKAAAEGQMSPSLSPQQRRQMSLLRMLKSGDEPVQWIAIKELGQIGSAEMAGELMPFMTSPNEDLRAAARDALAQIEKRAGMSQQQVTPPPPPPPPPTAPLPPTPMVRPRARPGTGAPRVRAEMPAAVETEREVRARRSDSTKSQERRAQEVQPSGAAPVVAPPAAPEEQRTAGDKLLPLLIGREQSMLPPMAEASQTLASVPGMAEMETSMPTIPDVAELPPV